MNAAEDAQRDDAGERTVSHIYKTVGISFLDIRTQNEALRACLTQAERAARSDVTVLLLGGPGTGKNLIVQAIHNASPRAARAFVAVNCSALTPSLVESELFGHVRGAYTGAERERRGRFELADLGTLFLDEIGDLSLEAQSKILRAVEYQEFERVGGEETLRVDTRLIAATNRDLAELIAQGRFREDLYYRLNEVTIGLPSLSQRPEDIDLLIRHFIQECNRKYGKRVRGISAEAARFLRAYPWPGNVRELRAAIKRGVAIAEGTDLSLEDLNMRVELVNARVEPGLEDLSLEAVERRHILRVLRQTSGNKTQACGLLKIARSTLDRKLEQYRTGEQESPASPASG